MTARGNDARTGRAANETAITKASIGTLAPLWSAPGEGVDGTEAIVVAGRVYAGYSTSSVPPGSNPPLTALGV